MSDVLDMLMEELGKDPNTSDFVRVATANIGWKNKELQAAADRVRMQEEGANSRARIAAGSSRAASANSLRAAQISAGTARRGQDIQRQIAEMENATRQELGRGQLGLQALELPAKYRGAADVFQQSDILHGMAGRQDVPLFVRSLLDNGTLAGYQMPGGQPTGFNIQGVLDKIGAGGGAAGGAMQGQNASALQAIRQLGQRGLHSLAPGALERLTPSELGALKSGLEYSGDGGPAWNFEDLYSGYKNAYMGQGDARAA